MRVFVVAAFLATFQRCAACSTHQLRLVEHVSSCRQFLIEQTMKAIEMCTTKSYTFILNHIRDNFGHKENTVCFLSSLLVQLIPKEVMYVDAMDYVQIF